MGDLTTASILIYCIHWFIFTLYFPMNGWLVLFILPFSSHHSFYVFLSVWAFLRGFRYNMQHRANGTFSHKHALWIETKVKECYHFVPGFCKSIDLKILFRIVMYKCQKCSNSIIYINIFKQGFLCSKNAKISNVFHCFYWKQTHVTYSFPPLRKGGGN